MSDAPNVEASDLFPVEVEFALRGGDAVVVPEFTLRQRDRIAEVLKSLGEDDAAKLVQDFLGFAEKPEGEDDGIEIAVVDLVKALTSKVADGVLSRLLAICLDVPMNRKLWADGDAVEWVLDHVTIRDEPALLAKILEVNDIRSYLGNLWDLTGMDAELKAKPEGETAEA